MTIRFPAPGRVEYRGTIADMNACLFWLAARWPDPTPVYPEN